MSGTSLVVQWLRLCAPYAGGMGLIPDQGTKIPHGTAKKKKKQCQYILYSKVENDIHMDLTALNYLTCRSLVHEQ